MSGQRQISQKVREVRVRPYALLTSEEHWSPAILTQRQGWEYRRSSHTGTSTIEACLSSYTTASLSSDAFVLAAIICDPEGARRSRKSRHRAHHLGEGT